MKSHLPDEEPYGVPQGSVLGPLLLLLHVNDLPDAMNCKCHLHADDTVIIIGKVCAEKLENKLNMELNNAEVWLSNSKLSLTNKRPCI